MAEKYITKSDVINHLQKIQNDKLADSDYKKFAWGMEIFIDGLPSADVVKIIRCKDCMRRDYCGIKEEIFLDDECFCSLGKIKGAANG